MAKSRMAQIFIFFIAVLLFFLPFLTIFVSKPVIAEQSGWLSSQDPALVITQTYERTEDMPGFINGVRCNQQNAITRPSRLVQSVISHLTCAVQTQYGSVSQSGFMQRPGTSVWGKIYFKRPARSFTAIPQSKSALITTVNTTTGSYLSFVDDVSNYISSVAIATGEVTHTLDNYPIRTIKDINGTRLPFRNTTVSFSVNGKWMIGDVPGQGMARVNVQTGQVLIFGPAFPYGSGISPGWQTALSADGRFAAISDRLHGTFRIYDLSTCEANSGVVANCQYKEIDTLLKTNVVDYFASSTPRFLNNDNLEITLSTNDDTVTILHKAHITAPGADNKTSFEYLGLGDSFASGEGAYSYKALTDTDQNRCHLSLSSYPYLISAQIGLSQYESVACSGAKQEHVRFNGDDFKGQTGDGISKEDRNIEQILTSFSPGFIEQIEFMKRNQPKAITISIGGNDVGFDDILVSCVMPGDCYNNRESREALLDVIDGQFNNLVQTYQELKNVSPNTKIYILSYPQVAKLGSSCDPNVHLSQKELAFANLLVSYINDVVRQATQKAGVFYADIESAMVGHRFCEAKYSDVAFNGLTAGNDKLQPEWLPVTNPFNGPIGNESYHPNQVGHRLFAAAIQAKTNNLTAAMPDEQPALLLNIDRGSLEILDIESSGQKRDVTIFYDQMTDDNTLVNDPLLISIPKQGINLAPNSPISVEIQSDPMPLGDFITDGNGQLFAQISVPNSVPAGLHQLHIFGTNIAGETVDIYKHILVAFSATDTDGDGILNTDDACSFVEPVGQDYDQDGIDDACDGIVGIPPEQNINTVSANGNQNELLALNSTPDETPGQTRAFSKPAAAAAPNYDYYQEPVVQAEAEQVAAATSDKPLPATAASRAAATADPKQTQHTSWWLTIIAGFIILIFITVFLVTIY